jgi:hypothetical protein
MRSAGGRLLRPWLCLGLLFLLGACNQVRTARPQDDDARFELKQDQQGRMLRLDKVTGEIAVVTGSGVTPLNSDAPRGPAAAARERAMARLAASSQSRRQGIARPPNTNQAVGLTSTSNAANISLTNASGGGRRSIEMAPLGPALVVKDGSGVFLSRNSYQTPLAWLNSGITVRVLALVGDWYQIEFDDSRIGPRVGFIHKTDVSSRPRSSNQSQSTASAAPMEPIDLSIPELKPPQMEPVDLSIRDRH